MSRNLHYMREVANWYSNVEYLKQQLPYIHGKWYFVDASDGNDSCAGTDPKLPLKTFAAAYGKTTSGNGDGICLFSRSDASGSNSFELTSALTFDKYGITVIGIAAPVGFFGRARIFADADADLASLITVSGQNNRFINLTISQEGDANTCLCSVIVTGARNSFEGVHFNLTHATPAGTAYASCLDLRASENVFRDCTIGSNSTTWAQASNGQLTFSTTKQGQNLFTGCRILSKSKTAGHGALYIKGTTTMNGWTIFRDCQFLNFSPDGGAITTIATVVTGDAQTDCGILIHNCSEVGWAAWSVLASKVYVGCSGETAAGAGGIATAPAA